MADLLELARLAREAKDRDPSDVAPQCEFLRELARRMVPLARAAGTPLPAELLTSPRLTLMASGALDPGPTAPLEWMVGPTHGGEQRPGLERIAAKLVAVTDQKDQEVEAALGIVHPKGTARPPMPP